MAASPFAPTRALRRGRIALLALALASAGLAGCKQELYSNLSEDEANQMMAVLMASGIQTDKASAGKTGFDLSVDNGDMLRAIAALKDAGYPKVKFDTIGDMFQPSGLMSSPFEERIRYIYALGQDVAQTLSRIDGVVTARVHIVLPASPELGEPVKPSSAAVFIKHEPGVDLDYFVPQIKRLVSSSIEGLDYSNVTVVLEEATPMKQVATPPRLEAVEVLPGVSVAEADQSRFWLWAIGVGSFCLLLGVSNLVILYLWRGKALFGSKGATATNPAVEPS
jgi:type III secretion protein J